MSTPVVFNGINYSVPAFGDVGYAQGPGNLSSYLIAIATGTLQTVGGSFPLTAQVNFGTGFGLTALDFISVTTLPATTGVLRLAKTDFIAWRNNANSANVALGINGTDQLTFNSVAVGNVDAGIAQRVAFYPASGNTIDDTTAFIVGAAGPNGIIVGSNAGDSAATGFVGEYVESVVSGVAFPASGSFGDLTSISLTAGDWDITYMIVATGNAGTVMSALVIGVSTIPGNSGAGLVQGSNRTSGSVSVSTVRDGAATIASYRVTIAGTTTFYAKFESDYTTATPDGAGRLSARRMR